MCGLFGHTGFDAAGIERSRQALHTLTHRGPDQWNDWSEDGVYLGHRRLSILDLSDHARQPLTTRDESTVLTVNGEIYNFRDLRACLSRSHEFKSQSDSEVLLHGYREWGIDGLLRRIDGMFAFALYDSTHKKLYLVRDRVGIKPLYYALRGSSVIWASELKAIESYVGRGKLCLDPSAAYDFLTYLYIPCPKTLYKDVYKLAPAHYMEIDVTAGTILQHQYWRLDVEPVEISLDSAAERLRELVRESVSEQMYSDVPIGFFLSGGLDSSVVVKEASTISRRVHSFSIGFEDPSWDETDYAESVATACETFHTSRVFAQSSLSDLFERLRIWYDEPFGDTSAFPTFAVSQLARQDSTVVLTGDGGDEVFGGYNWYRLFQASTFHEHKLLRALLPLISPARRRWRTRVLGRVLNRFENSALNPLEMYAKLLGGLLKHEKSSASRRLGIEKDYDDYWYFRGHYRDELSPLTRMQFLDFHTYLPDDILTKVDRVSMAVSLEVRVPLLSRKLVEFAFGLPEQIRYAGGDAKGLLRYAYRNELPRSVLERGKQGFSLPSKGYLTGMHRAGVSRQQFILDRFFPECLGLA